MQIIHAALLLAVLFLIAGCSTPTPPAAAAKSDYSYYAEAKAAAAAKPLFEMECPSEGCIVKALRVNNPNSAADAIAAPAPPPRVEHAVVGVMREAKEMLLGLAPSAVGIVGAKTVAKVFDSFGSTSVAIANKIQAPVVVTPPANQTVNVTGNNSAGAIGGAATSTGAVTTTLRTTTCINGNGTGTGTGTGSNTPGSTTNTNPTTGTPTTPTTGTTPTGTNTGTGTGTGSGTGTGTSTQNCP